MGNLSETVWVAFNGELYNVKELRSDLRAAGHVFRTRSDTECLLHLYEEARGDANWILPRLRGMFAFAIWDTEQQRLLLARDRLGIKPVHWVAYSDGLGFASEARALALSGLASGEPDHRAIIEYLAWGSVSSPLSIFAGVSKLPAGHYLTWDGGSPVVHQWWAPVARPDPALGDDESATLWIRDAIKDSVGRHLIADRTVGLFLSSGIDSTAVATVAASLGRQRSLTVTFPEAGDELDEGAAAAETARQLGIEHEMVPVLSSEVGELFHSALGSLDHPTTDAFNSWIVCRAAAQAGMVVALSGLGGDELFGGYPTFRLLAPVLATVRLASVAPGPARDRLAARFSARWPGGRVSHLLTAQPGVTGAYAAIRRLFSDADLRQLGVGSPDQALPAMHSGGDEITRLELTRFMANQLLADVDSVSMAHSLEVRLPLIDDLFVERALAVPASVRLATGKELLARAGDVGINRKKRPFAMPIDAWIRGPLRSIIQEGVISDELPFSDMIDRKGRAVLWQSYLDGRVHWSRPWSLAVLRLWPAANGLVW
jgi:asparagine synthase (glutamine-hydrolysing)